MGTNMMQNGPAKKKGGKKGVIALIAVLVVVVIALAVILVMFMGRGDKPDQTFTAKDINATVVVSGQIVSLTSQKAIEVDGKENAVLELNAEGGEITEHLGFNTNTTLNSSSNIHLFYEFTNRSSGAMYVTFGKEVADDNNFLISIYYRCADGELKTVKYYTANGKYYNSLDDMNSAINAMDTVAMTEGAKVNSGASMTMRIELSVIAANVGANINCNFAFTMMSEAEYAA